MNRVSNKIHFNLCLRRSQSQITLCMKNNNIWILRRSTIGNLMELRPIKTTSEKSRLTTLVIQWSLKHTINRKFSTKKNFCWNKTVIFWKNKGTSIDLKEVKYKEVKHILFITKKFWSHNRFLSLTLTWKQRKTLSKDRRLMMSFRKKSNRCKRI